MIVRITVNDCAPPRRPAGIQADRAFGHDGVELSSLLAKPTKLSSEMNCIDDVSYIEVVVNALVQDALVFDALHRNSEDASNRPMAEDTKNDE
jgi:hypothetical protein